MYRQRIAAEDARKMKADHMIAVAIGVLTPLDVLESALHATHRPLRTVRLSSLFGPLDKGAPKAAKKSHVPWRTLRPRLLSALDLDPRTPDKTLTIGWVHDPRAGGRRWFALRDALRPRDEPPWPGFPWAPPPT